MKKVLFILLISIVSLTGLGFLLYPHISFWLAKQNQSYVIQEYDNDVARMKKEKRTELLEQAKVYNAELTGSGVSDAFAAGEKILGEQYLSLLCWGQSTSMGYIKIPKIKTEIPIYHGTALKTLEKGVGHLEGTALPIGGEGNHCVLTSHSGMDSSRMFTDLYKLETGDEFYLYVMDQVCAYKVDQIVTVLPEDTKDLQPVKGKDYTTLITCTPYGVNTHRLLVRGERVDHAPEDIEKRIGDTRTVLSRETFLLLVGVGGLGALVLLCTVIKKIWRR